jgi:hypothetical protein
MTPTTTFVMIALGVMAIFFAIAGWRRRRSQHRERKP